MTAMIDVRPETFSAAAHTVGEEVARCVQLACIEMVQALADTGGMAGSDETGRSWGASYDSAAATALTATRDLVVGCFRLAALLEQTGINYAGAEAASVPGDPAEVALNRWQSTPAPDFGQVPGAMGFGVPQPAGWTLLQDHIDAIWPNGHQDLLHQAADAWQRACWQIFSVVEDVDSACVALLGERTPGSHDAVAVVTGVRQQLIELSAAYEQIAGACTDYAHHLDEAHHQVIDELESFVKWTIAIEAAGGVLAFVTAGISEIAAQGGEVLEATRVGLAITRIIRLLKDLTDAVALRVHAAAISLAAVSVRVEPLLARDVAVARLAEANREGSIPIGIALPTQTATDVELAGVTSTRLGGAVNRLEKSADTIDAGGGVSAATREAWNRLWTLDDHFVAHAADFGATSIDDYVARAVRFRDTAEERNLPMKAGKFDTIQIYDPETNTFGVYTRDGKVVTFFKPERQNYWRNQPGEVLR